MSDVNICGFRVDPFLLLDFISLTFLEVFTETFMGGVANSLISEESGDSYSSSNSDFSTDSDE